jgi:hypothetical protein
MTERARWRRNVHGERGAVYVETILCLVPLLTLFFGVAQLAFVASARLVVRHAAAQGVRAAVVLLEDDPKHFGGEPDRGDLLQGDAANIASELHAALGQVASLGAGATTSEPQGGARLQAIREAVYVPLAVLAPSSGFLTSGGSRLATAIGSSPLLRFAFGALVYSRGAAAITLRAAPGSDEVLDEVGPHDDVTVHVTYLFHCGVPLASLLLCNPLWDLAGYGKSLSELQKLDPSKPLEVAVALEKLRDDFPPADEYQRIADELARAESPVLLLPYLLSGGRFLVIEAEATLPNQGADYYSR